MSHEDTGLLRDVLGIPERTASGLVGRYGIVVHNHPSGDETPSREDIAVTGRLVEAGKIVGIGLLDHRAQEAWMRRKNPEEGISNEPAC